MPKKIIKIKDDIYTYQGNIPNTKYEKKKVIDYERKKGKKIVFKNDGEWGLAVYMSLKTFDTLITKYGSKK